MSIRKANKAIRAITAKIVKEYKPEKVILFGSYAWGKPHEDSDVDLLVVKETKKPRFDREIELRKLLYPPAMAFDILIYTAAELEEKIREDRNLFLEDIVKNGVLLYARDKIRGELVSARR